MRSEEQIFDNPHGRLLPSAYLDFLSTFVIGLSVGTSLSAGYRINLDTYGSAPYS
jgi:hypothetical protein